MLLLLRLHRSSVYGLVSCFYVLLLRRLELSVTSFPNRVFNSPLTARRARIQSCARESVNSKSTNESIDFHTIKSTSLSPFSHISVLITIQRQVMNSLIFTQSNPGTSPGLHSLNSVEGSGLKGGPGRAPRGAQGEVH